MNVFAGLQIGSPNWVKAVRAYHQADDLVLILCHLYEKVQERIKELESGQSKEASCKGTATGADDEWNSGG
jgi:hypothetical protein